MISHTPNSSTSAKSLHQPSRTSLGLEFPDLLPSLPSSLRGKSKQTQQGSALIYVLAVILIGAALSAGIVSMTTTSTFTGLSYNTSDQARFLAQSGLEYIKTKPQGFADFDETVFSLENGEFELTVSKTGGSYEVTSIGRVHPGTSREASFKILSRISEVMLEYLFELADDLGRDTGGNSLHGTVESGVARNPKLCSSDFPAYTDPLDADQSTCYFASFDGVDSGISMGAADLEFEDEMTVMAWVRWDDYQNGDDNATIVTSTHHGTSGQFWLQQHTDRSRYEFAVETEQERKWVWSNSVIDDQVWQHVTGVYDGSQIKIYVDGIFQEQPGWKDEDLSGNILAQTGNYEFKIGNNKWKDRRFHGDIDDVRVFDVALSEADINAYRTKTRECKIPRMVAEYRFDECTWGGNAGEVLDSSGNNLHGTIFGTPAPDTGKINNAGSFINGENMGISLPGSPTLKPQEGITISAWIKRIDVSNLGLQNIYHFGNWQQFLRLDQTSDIVFSLTGKGTLRASGVVNNLDWNHVAATYDDNKMVIYVNGQEQASQNASGNIEYTGNQFIIGNISTGSPASFNGKIDELKIFDKALTSQQISTLYDNENSGKNCDGTTREAIICNDNGDDNDNGNGNDEESTDFITDLIEEDVFVYGSQLSFAGGSVTGHGATVVIQGGLVTSDLGGGSHINVSNIYIGGDVDLDGGSASLGSDQDPGVIYVDGNMKLWNGSRNIYGDVYVMGNFDLKDARIHGNVYVDGDLTLGWTPWLAPDSRIYYTGNRLGNTSGAVLQKCIKVDTLDNAPGYDPGLEMPGQEVPGPRPDSWYAERGYASSGILVSNLKVFADSYSSTSWRPTANDVVIVSKSDITVTGLGGSGLTGVLFAPYGRVTFGGGFFEGTVIARDGFFVTSGGTEVRFRNIEDYFSNSDDIPIAP
jgi:hypothetical protein